MSCGNNLVTQPGTFGSQTRGCNMAEAIDLEIDREEPRETLRAADPADMRDIAN